MPTVKTKGRPKRLPAKPCKGCQKRTRRASGYCTACEPGATAEKKAATKARKKAVRGSAGSTRAQRVLREAVIRRDGFRCQAAGCDYHESEDLALGRTDRRSKLHADHIVPAVEGGPTTLENLQTLCADHNLKKGPKLAQPRTTRSNPARSKRTPPAPPPATPRLGLPEVRGRRSRRTEAKCARCEKNPVRFPGARCADCLPTSLAKSPSYARKAKGRR